MPRRNRYPAHMDLATAVEALHMANAREIAALAECQAAQEAAVTARNARDDAIRDALAAGTSYRALGEITGLSRTRLDQIRRRSND